MHPLFSHGRWKDWALVILLGASAATASLLGSSRLSPVLYTYEAYNAWFDADIGRVMDNMTNPMGDNGRANLHPLFAFLTIPIVTLLTKVSGLTPLGAMNAWLATLSAIWIAMIYLVLRLIGCRALDATLFTGLALCSAFSVFWLAIPETFILGSIGILSALAGVGIAQHRKISDPWYIGVSAFTASATVTNWMAGIVATWADRDWRRTLQITVYAFVALVTLWIVQKQWIPSSSFVLSDLKREVRYINPGDLAHIASVFIAFFSHSVVMPEIDLGSPLEGQQWALLSVQHAVPGSGTAFALPAVLLWWALLVVGVTGALRASKDSRIPLALGALVLGQFLLYLLYGAETFLFSLHFGPLLVILAGYGTRTRARVPVLLLAASAIILISVNNLSQWSKATALIQEGGTRRPLVSDHMDAVPRVHDARLLSLQHAWASADQAYAFSPRGTLVDRDRGIAISFWVSALDDHILETSDDAASVWLRDQAIRWREDHSATRLMSNAGYYGATWSRPEPGLWALKTVLDTRRAATQLMLVVRPLPDSVRGIHALDWDGRTLRIDDDLTLSFRSAPRAVHLGELVGEGVSTRRDIRSWRNDQGKGFARIVLPAISRIDIADTTSTKGD